MKIHGKSCWFRIPKQGCWLVDYAKLMLTGLTSCVRSRVLTLAVTVYQRLLLLWLRSVAGSIQRPSPATAATRSRRASQAPPLWCSPGHRSDPTAGWRCRRRWWSRSRWIPSAGGGGGKQGSAFRAQTQTQTYTHRQTDTHIHTHTHRQTDTHTHTHTAITVLVASHHQPS